MKKNKIIRFLFTGVIIILGIFLISLLTSCTHSVSLYFAAQSETEAYLVKETREIPVSESFYENVLKELIKGPESSDLYPTVPSDVKVNSVKISNGTAVVDFSREIITNFEEIPHSSTTEMLAIFSIVNTLTEFEDIDTVRITVEGRQSGQVEGLYIEDFWGHIGIHEEFTRDETIIKDS
jgi:germination protein M